MFNAYQVEGNLAAADDAIMLDVDGFVSETNATNIVSSLSFFLLISSLLQNTPQGCKKSREEGGHKTESTQIQAPGIARTLGVVKELHTIYSFCLLGRYNTMNPTRKFLTQ